MAYINLLPPVVSADLDLMRVQQRFEAAVVQLVTTPWGDGVLVSDVALASSSGNQTIKVRHGLGRAARGALVGNCNVAFYGPWNVATVDNNNCNITVNLPSGVPAGTLGALDVWVY